MAPMLEELRITSLGVIEEAVLELGPGLTVVTGETGAGKTMVVTALSLLLGGRADTGAVRAGAKAARVEGLLNLADADESLTDRVDELGADVEDDRLLLGRHISAEGRSRAFAGGVAVPAAVLASLADPLVAVHGQSDQHRLLRSSTQRDALDSFAGNQVLELRSRYSAVFRALRETESELAEVVASDRERAREADLLRFGVGEVKAVAPESGEDIAMAAEEARLGYADTLRTAAEQARECLTSEERLPGRAWCRIGRAQAPRRRPCPRCGSCGSGRAAGRGQLPLVRRRGRCLFLRRRFGHRPEQTGCCVRAPGSPHRPDPEVRRDRGRGALVGGVRFAAAHGARPHRRAHR